MNVPEDLKYTKTHEWISVTGNTARIGITDFAQHELTDVVFVELPKKGADLKAGDSCAVLESVKTASDIYAPLTGRVVELNKKVQDAPELVNKDPYGGGWLFELEIKYPAELDGLLSSDAYKNLIV